MKNYFKFESPHPKIAIMYYTPIRAKSMAVVKLTGIIRLFTIFHLMRERKYSFLNRCLPFDLL